MSVMKTDLLAYLLTALHARVVPWAEVSRATGVPYETLKKIALGYTKNPGVLHVQKLAAYFAERESGCKAVAVQQAPQTETVDA